MTLKINSIRVFLLFIFFISSEFLYGKEKIALCIMATGKYIEFAERLIESARTFFLNDCNVDYIVFTNNSLSCSNDIKIVYQPRLGWPYDTLMRFDIYNKNRKTLENYDYIFALDADMLFVSTVGKEILGDLVGTLHPGFFNKPRKDFSYEFRRKSTACIKPSEGKYYFAGGFYGGKRDCFFHLLEETSKNISIDLKNKLIAVWHDESHLNRYFINNPPLVVLSPAYCYPENLTLAFEKKILALDKNHSQIREDF